MTIIIIAINYLVINLEDFTASFITVIIIALFVSHLSMQGYKVLHTKVHGKNEESILTM